MGFSQDVDHDKLYHGILKVHHHELNQIMLGFNS